MHSTPYFSRFAAVLVISLASISALHLGSALPGRAPATPATDRAQASTAPVVVAQFSPCPNNKCR